MILEVEAKNADLAKAELLKQRKRNLFFSNSHIFGDPAWELALEAYIAGCEHRCVVLSDLGNDLRRPDSFITRLATILEVEGYVERCRSHNNQDLSCLQLTEDAVAWCERSLDLKSGGGNFHNN
tara:strand:+ start:468 stop:839 length:372 start_codon:yes stop_codon:yes gene_type:complete